MNDNTKIHVKYIIGILLAVIIALVAFQWHDIPKLVELITFALTVTSLVLAILAIAYAVYSNSTFTQNISALNQASNDLSVASKDITSVTKDLKVKVESIPTKLESVEDKVDRLILLGQAADSSETRGPNPHEKAAATDIAGFFIETSTSLVWVVSYGFALSYQKRTPFLFTVLYPSSSGFNSLYAHAVLLTMKASGLLDFDPTRTTDKQWEYLVVQMNDKLVESLMNHFDEVFGRKIKLTLAAIDDEKLRTATEKTIKELAAGIKKFFDEN